MEMSLPEQRWVVTGRERNYHRPAVAARASHVYDDSKPVFMIIKLPNFYLSNHPAILSE